MTEPRKRDATATTEAILTAARDVFTEKGYDGAGTREIADRAQVNVALISRYFGSKQGLFAVAVPPKLTLDSLISGDMRSFGARAAAAFANNPAKPGFDPMIALLRAAASPDAVPALRQALQDQVTTPLAQQLTGENRSERAAMVGALLVGFHLVARVLSLTSPTQGLEQTLADSLQRLVDQR